MAEHSAPNDQTPTTPPEEQVLVLIGLRGSGKTTVGRALAQRLNCPWSDLDERALALCAQPTIQAVFEGPGEARWRAAEADALRSALAERPSVLSLGGGAPTVHEVKKQLQDARRAGGLRVIWLDASAECLARRVEAHDQERPPLRLHPDGSPLSPLEESRLLEDERSETYRALADQVVEADQELDEVLEAILEP